MKAMSKAKGLSNILLLIDTVKNMVNAQYDTMFTEEFQNVIHGGTKFDLLLFGYCINDFQLAVAHQLKVPVVISWVNQPMSSVNIFVGNPNSLSIVPHLMLTNAQPMSFIERLKTFLMSGLTYGIEKYVHYKFAEYFE